VRLPPKYEIVDRVWKWGVDIRDPLAVRQLSDTEEPDDEVIMTSKTEKGKKDIANR
jgi:hypothetical protein